jgi:RNase P subunit RPR2
MTITAPVHDKIEGICRQCGNTLASPELAEFFSEEQLILNLWSCSSCGFQFETEEKICSEATPQI